ncbi:glycoside hydrolase family 108 protein [Salinarimonas chemoclinalis]|uniref:glycoside hydrolase family 108 protein n=1 Tax=Salinarimonas chemoclinalis TaxID=3241599 RepID=UPI003555F947
MNPLIALALQLVPDAARAFAGGKAGDVAASVSRAVAEAAGTSDPQAAQVALVQDPAKLADLRIKLAQIAAQAQSDRRADDLADTESARATFAQLAKAGNAVGLAPVIISVIVTVGFFVMLIWLLVREPTLTTDSAVLQLINITIGALTAAFATVVNFWLGSSHGSRIKDQLSATLQAQAAGGDAKQVSAALGAHSAQIEAAVQAFRAATASALAPTPVAVPSPAPSTADADRRFDACVTIVLQLEGGYVDDPHDPGGATNMGITLNTLRDWRKDQSLGPDDVKALTETEAKAIYRANYWNPMQCDGLPAGVDLSVFDFGVNAGPSRSVKLLESLVGTAQDGIMGPQTLAATAAQDAPDLIRRFADGRIAYYRSLSGWDRYGNGWTNRTNTVEKDALAMAGG